MTIVEEKNTKAPDIKRPHFVVDYKIKNIVKPFPEQASYIVFCGASRSGKSSLDIVANEYFYVQTCF